MCINIKKGDIKVKKSISLVLVVCICLVFSGSSFAMEDSRNNKFKMNEYEYLKYLQNKSTTELRGLSFTGEEIEEIRTLDYKKELERRKDYDENTLKLMGYSNKDIKTLKSFNGTEKEMRALAGVISGNACVITHMYNKTIDKTRVVYSFFFRWEKPPVVQLKDIIGVMWSGDYLVRPETGIELYYNELGNEDITEYKKPKFENTSSFSCTFNVGGGGNFSTKLLESGHVLLDLECKGRNSNSAALFKYGHSVLVVNPTLSLGNSMSLSFEPSFGINEELNCYCPSTIFN